MFAAVAAVTLLASPGFAQRAPAAHPAPPTTQAAPAPDEETLLWVKQNTLMAARCEAIPQQIMRLDQITATNLLAAGGALENRREGSGAGMLALAKAYAEQAAEAQRTHDDMAGHFLHDVLPHAGVAGLDPAKLQQLEQTLAAQISSKLASEIDAAMAGSDAVATLIEVSGNIAQCHKWASGLAVTL